MRKTAELSGVPGMLRPFKAFITEAGLNDGDQIVYYGCPGTCTPFIELLAYAIRDLPFTQVFVPLLDETQAKVLKPVSGVGMQVSAESIVPSPAVVVMMGGLSMPNVPVSAEMAVDTIAGYHARTVGICFMGMFEKTGWLSSLPFELLIDANISPVDVYQGEP
ncbi:MAG: DUF2124 domain-containing protein [Methanomicrobiales archaeon]|nr:DUF2124 domain-containing protein [Methanomicrobiales archaeon]